MRRYKMPKIKPLNLQPVKRPKKRGVGEAEYSVPRKRRKGDPTLVNPLHPSKSDDREVQSGGRNHKQSLAPLVMRRIENDSIIGNIKVRKVLRIPSTWGARVAPMLRDAYGKIVLDKQGIGICPTFDKYEHQTGEVECTCLHCNKQFNVDVRRLHPNNLNTTLWSCGCCKRPEQRTKPRSGGRKPTVIVPGLVLARLETLMWLKKQGWLCRCTCGETTIVNARNLKHQSIRGCAKCDPVGWSSKRGKRRKLHEVDGRPFSAFNIYDEKRNVIGNTLLWWQKEE